MKRVVITAASGISPIGHGKENMMSSIKKGKSGIRKLFKNDICEFLGNYIHTGIIGSIKYDISYDFEKRFRKTMAPCAYYACQVAKEVIEASGLDDNFVTSGRVGVSFNSSHGGTTVQGDIYRKYFAGDFNSIGVADYLKAMTHTTAINITKMFGITGRAYAPCTVCTTGSQAIGFGYEAIKFGLQDAMLCGGADEHDPVRLALFDNLMACSTAFNDTPCLTPRPFDIKRDGLVVGEGGGAVMLEEYEFARKRGAPILGEIIGFSTCNNGGDLILPNVNGIVHTIETGLKSANLRPSQVDLISAHATATKQGDIIEAQAIHRVYGDKPSVIALKSYMGHTMAACGVIELILVLYMMEQGFIAPTLNLEEPDPECAMIRHVMKLTDAKVNIASVQNFAFGGVNTCLFVKKEPERKRGL